ncbi:uncharacterized protein ATC70_003664 [Mucor velutinosus]|uniref:SCP2 domain-containing protein n=1 Tax=Mucor velutinosus TaxID=708070 RepID=A0AAN7D9Z9_9FUNG|nr:hypothetical protein ATC70_003664 [Mucor velutinosus]
MPSSTITNNNPSTAFKSDAVFKYLDAALRSLTEDDKSKLLSKISGVFQFTIKNNQGKTQAYMLDLKKGGSVTVVKSAELASSSLNESFSPDVVLYICDGDIVDLVKGRLNGQRAFMLGKLKIKGRMDLAIKLDAVFRQLVGRSNKL